MECKSCSKSIKWIGLKDIQLYEEWAYVPCPTCGFLMKWRKVSQKEENGEHNENTTD